MRRWAVAESAEELYAGLAPPTEGGYRCRVEDWETFPFEGDMRPAAAAAR